MNHMLNITVDSLRGDLHYSCEIDLKPWLFCGKKGYNSFDVESNRVNVYWDLRSAKFSGSPEPCSDYYIALMSNEEVEQVYGKKNFGTRARFDERNQEHDIMVESTIAGHREPEMWIYVDGISVLHIRNLNWKFRGNQMITVANSPYRCSGMSMTGCSRALGPDTDTGHSSSSPGQQRAKATEMRVVPGTTAITAMEGHITACVTAQDKWISASSCAHVGSSSKKYRN
ncbi:hypothetical protein MLD38_033101 [Melastoma candidum]|uniref:Uncharacterized protein n=1 Tax=Melastoma candidum TaxID=119954 RepID=A0ACB9M5H9_9MYRT|nr:hypothetical protein MLD38_033101 [Melastoma candidum]